MGPLPIPYPYERGRNCEDAYDCVGNDSTVKLELGARVVHPLALPRPCVPLTLGRRGNRSDLRMWFPDSL